MSVSTMMSVTKQAQFKTAQHDSVGNYKPELIEKPYKLQIVWKNVLIFVILHAVAFWLQWDLFMTNKRYNWKTKIFCVVYRFVVSLGVTVGYHRYFTHRSFKTNTFGRVVLMLSTCLTYQNSIYTWVRDHRLHHRHSETDADPHNAKRGFFFSHIGWLMVRKHPDVKEYGNNIDMSDLVNDPIIMFNHKYYYYLVILCTLIVPTCILTNICGTTAMEALCLAFRCLVMSLHVTWSVNSFAHLKGPKIYSRYMGPVQNIFVSLIAIGEGYHNYHHTYPWDYKTSEYSNDPINVAGCFIDLLAKIGLVSDLKTVPPEIVERHVSLHGNKSLWKKMNYYQKFSLRPWALRIVADVMFIKFFMFGEMQVFSSLYNTVLVTNHHSIASNLF